jgi:hypothetical protein
MSEMAIYRQLRYTFVPGCKLRRYRWKWKALPTSYCFFGRCFWFRISFSRWPAGCSLASSPEALISRVYYNTGLEPYSPAIAASSFLLGYFVGYRLLSLRAASWPWLIGIMWLLFGFHELTSYWHASWSPEKTSWGYALANLFGPTLKCGG